MNATPQAVDGRRAALHRRRRAGLLLGAFLAFIFGGWAGLLAALVLVGIVGIVDFIRAHRAGAVT